MKALSIDDSTLYRKIVGVGEFMRSEIQELRALLELDARGTEAVNTLGNLYKCRQ